MRGGEKPREKVRVQAEKVKGVLGSNRRGLRTPRGRGGGNTLSLWPVPPQEGGRQAADVCPAPGRRRVLVTQSSEALSPLANTVQAATETPRTMHVIFSKQVRPPTHQNKDIMSDRESMKATGGINVGDVPPFVELHRCAAPCDCKIKSEIVISS